MTPECLVLLSGGLDSAVTAAWAKHQGFRLRSIAFDYGQRHRIELQLAAEQATLCGSVHHQLVRLPVGEFGGSSLTDPLLAMPQGDMDVPVDASHIPLTYVPVRNLVFLSVAGALAEAEDIGAIALGVNAVDFSGYPDCRPAFIEAFNTVLNLASRRYAEGGAGFQILTPLQMLKKVDIIRLGLELGVDFARTNSCYDPGNRGTPCQHCDSCRIRGQAFQAVGMQDPRLLYTMHSSNP